MKTALVTGSSRGIGRGIADLLLDSGYTVIYSGTRPQRPDNLSEDCDYIGCDISDSAQRKAAFDYVLGRYGRLDVLVNNAGVAPLVRADILETTEESFDRVLGINLKGTFFMCQAAANIMSAALQENLEDYTPRIVNIGSMSAYTSSTSRGEYCISKAGVSMVTTLFADRLAALGIPVFEVRPGIIDTDMTKVVHEKYENLIAGGLTPIPRFGKPEDVAKMVLACCSGMLDFSAGQVLNADGGFAIRRL
ncbi:MAG: 3-ketoacyl-ACP reductase, partial [Eubacteriales bacterium]|nr:3-ketoacyl-ACP reductase [Eubacteriales bacterium]